MLRQETTTIEERLFDHTYSDAGFRIRQEDTGIIYDDAIDPHPTAHVYSETDIPLDDDEDVTPEELAAILEEEVI